MGRRKIAIQPITNDRTRSVTFLKRKTGLFKKAYELGVLCSVDVAVIIFERKPSHPDKLFQYCSTDINGLVQRQIRFDGERDLRTPQDFSGSAAASRADDMPDDDDDDGDADDSPVLQYMRHDSLKGKTDPESSLVPRSKREVPEIDYRSHLHHSGLQPTSSPTHPVSADRHTKPHASGSRVASSSSSFTRQSPNPRKRIKVDVQSTAAPSPVLSAFTPRSDADLSHTRALHSRVQPPAPLLPPPPYQPGYFPGFTPHVSPTTVPSSAGGALHIPTSFPSPTAAGPSSGAPLPLLPPYGSPRHPPRITQPHFGPSTDDLFANVFGPAGGSGVGLDPEFDFLAPPPLTFEWPQFAPATQAAAGGNGQQGHSGSPVASGAGGDSGSSWLDFLSGATSDAPRSPRTGKRSRGDAPGDTGEGHARDAAGGNGSG